jgi:hypothetical protein
LRPGADRKRPDQGEELPHLLTPRGIEEKAKITVEFLKVKIAEHEALTKEIKNLREEAVQVQARQHSGVSAKKGAR